MTKNKILILIIKWYAMLLIIKYTKIKPWNCLDWGKAKVKEDSLAFSISIGQ